MNTSCVSCLNATHVFSPFSPLPLFLPLPLISSPVFHKLQGDQALLQKVVYVLANLVGVGLAVYKFNNMGLLPTAQSDWLEFMEARQVSAALCSSFTRHQLLWPTDVSYLICFFLSPSGFGNVGRRISTCMTVCLYYKVYVYSHTSSLPIISLTLFPGSPMHKQKNCDKSWAGCWNKNGEWSFWCMGYTSSRSYVMYGTALLFTSPHPETILTGLSDLGTRLTWTDCMYILWSVSKCFHSTMCAYSRQELIKLLKLPLQSIMCPWSWSHPSPTNLWNTLRYCSGLMPITRG